MATINNVAYSWSMIQLTSSSLTGTSDPNPHVLVGVSAIEWNTKQNIQTNYGLGGKGVNRGFGNIEHSAKITMDYNTQLQLRGGLSSLRAIGEFDLVISYANPVGENISLTDLTTETVTLKGCVFSEDGMDAKQDDTNLTKEFVLNPFDIIINTV